MLTVILTRGYFNGDATLGMIQIANMSHQPIFTLENSWHDNTQNISCIPEGEYTCKPHDGTKYQDVWEVCKVPNRKNILIHWGNVSRNTNGCILVGKSSGTMEGLAAVMSSRSAIKYLQSLVGIESSFKLKIIDVVGA